MNFLQRVSRLGTHWIRCEANGILLKNGSYRLSSTSSSPITTPVTWIEPKEGEVRITVSSPVGSDKNYPPKIVQLVNDIAKLTLLEVSELNELLKKTLNIPDTPMMGAMSFAPQASAKEEEVEAVPLQVQTSFTLKLLRFDDTKKVALIKEMKNLVEGMNLVQAKKFVESAPAIVKADIPKEEAQKLQAALEAVGGTCEIS